VQLAPLILLTVVRAPTGAVGSFVFPKAGRIDDKSDLAG
jgi:hypothetical protein